MPSKRELREKWNNAGKDVVTLHMFSRGRKSPNPSPYPIKLELFLRITEIKHEIDYDQPLSAKGKSPWITINGKDIADSQLCVEYLQKELEKDIDSHLSAEQKAISRGFRALMEDHFYFALLMDRWLHNNPKKLKRLFGDLGVPKFMEGFAFAAFKKSLKKQAVGQGMGKHKREEVEKMAKQDMETISAYLGDKPFIMGNEVSLIDCVVFGFTSQLLDDEECTFTEKFNELTNLKEHALRMKEKYYPDWEDCLFKEKVKEEKKKKKDEDKDKKDDDKKDEDKDKKKDDKKEDEKEKEDDKKKDEDKE